MGDAGRTAARPDIPVPRDETPDMHRLTTERSVIFTTVLVVLMLITSIASSRRLVDRERSCG
ncbi:hypothetical protein WQ59_15720 [Streptomyces sp. KE1]|nr:hypothetical protein WQ59_15720 [Streptomyces sp. KE1]